MSIINNVNKFYSGNLTMLGTTKEIYQNYGKTFRKEQRLINDRDYGYDDDLNKDGECTAASLRIGLLKNVVTFSEIISYKGTYLRDMDNFEKNEAINSIIEDLPNMYEPPVAYEVLKDSVVICIVVSPLCAADEIDMLIATEWKTKLHRNKY